MKLVVSPDKNRAKALFTMAQVTKERLCAFDRTKYPANSLLDYYDILHECMEALCALQGVKFKGEGAHKELIDHLCTFFSLKEKQRIFLQELREYRNRITYEGFSITADYIKTREKEIEEIYSFFKEQLEKRL